MDNLRIFALRLAARPPNWTILAVVATLFLAVAAFLVGQHVGPGSNFALYEHFAQYRNTHGAYPTAQVDSRAYYFDFTALNAVIYRLLFASPGRLHQAVFTAYELLTMLAGFLGAIALSNLGKIRRVELLAIVVFFVANPLVWRFLLSEDKANFFALPILCILALETFGFIAFAGAIGLFAGWLGIGLAALPLLAADRAQPLRGRALALVVAGAITAACFVVEGRDILVAIANRVTREGLDPIWYSVWQFIPGGGNAMLRKIVTVAFILCFPPLVWSGRLPLVPAFVAASTAYLLFSNTATVDRVMFYAPALIFCFAGTRARIAYLAGTAGVLTFAAVGYTLASRHFAGHMPAALLAVFVLACNLPIVVPVIQVMRQAFGARPPAYSAA
jgi:hypothetical protein